MLIWCSIIIDGQLLVMVLIIITAEGTFCYGGRESSLQLQKTHANRKSTSKSRKHLHQFDSRCCKCSQHKQIKNLICSVFLCLVVLCCEYLQCASLFCCVVSICSALLYLVVLWAFATSMLINCRCLQVFFLFVALRSLGHHILLLNI